ncbi:cytochrome b/b6 domain-containing protein [Yoonia sp. MH D7]
MMTPTTYSTTTKAFHWLTALLILAIIPLGLIANKLPVSTDAEIAVKTLLFSLHKTFGVTVFLVAVARIGYAVTQVKPAPLHPDRKAETLLAAVVHWLLYLSLVLVPLTGWIHHSASAVAAPIWLPFAHSLPFVPRDPTVADLFGGLHWLWSKIMVTSILLHIAGALKHQFVDKDETLKRMWFGATSTPPAQVHHRYMPAIAAAAVFAVVAGIGAAAGILSGKAEVAGGVALEVQASEWVVQDGTIGISVTQLGNPVAGQFDDWVSVISYDEAASGPGIVGHVETTINIGSLTLGSVSDQAMGADFFNQATYPTALFVADIVKDGSDLRADGTLTIKDFSLPVTMPFELAVLDDLATMSGMLQLDRRDFAMGSSMSDESNLGFAVDVQIDLTASR